MYKCKQYHGSRWRTVRSTLLVISLMSMVTTALADTTAQVILYGNSYELILQKNDRLNIKGIRPSGEHFRGRLRGYEQSWVRVSRVDGRWQGIVSFADGIYVIDSPAVEPHQGAARGLTQPTMEAKPVSSYESATCAVDHGAESQNILAGRPLAAESTVEDPLSPTSSRVAQQALFSTLCATAVDGICLLAELEVAFDQLFQQAMTDAGLSPQDQALSMINMVEGFYRNDFGIAFDVLNLEFLDGATDVFSTTTDPFVLLDDIAAKRQSDAVLFEQNDRSIFHLVTGRDFDMGAAGIAYKGMVCEDGDASGTTRLIGIPGSYNIPLTAQIVAHEIGHNFDAGHDGQQGNTCANGFIMQPTAIPGATNFSTCSIDEIEAYISTIATPAACMNFPVDVEISAAVGNPAQVTAGDAFTLEYQVQTASAYQAVSQVIVSGSVPNGEGQFSAVTLNGTGCTVAPDGLSYQCTLDNPPATAALLATATAEVGQSTFTHQVVMANTSDVIDVDQSNEQQVSLLIVNAASNAVPVADDQVVATDEDVSIGITLTASDADGDALSYAVETGPNNGTLSGTAPNLTYTPNNDYSGSDSFTFTVNDGISNSNVATVNITVNPDNNKDAPTIPGGGGGSSSWPLLIMFSSLLWYQRRQTLQVSG